MKTSTAGFTRVFTAACSPSNKEKIYIVSSEKEYVQVIYHKRCATSFLHPQITLGCQHIPDGLLGP